MPLLNPFFKILDRCLEAIEVTSAAILLSSAVFVVLADILSRTVLGHSISWATELARYAIIWMVFIGSSLAARTGAHITIDVAAELLPTRFARILLFFASILSAIGCALIAYLGQTLVSMMMMFSQKSPSLEIPMWIIYCIIPVSFLMMSVRFIQAGFAIQMDQRRLNLAASAG